MEERKTIYLCLAHMSEEGLEQKYVKEAFDTNWVVPIGPNVNAFEQNLADFANTNSDGSKLDRKVVCLSAGTAAVHLALIACGVQPGDEVCVQSFTFCASSHPITYLGAKPVFIDSERETWNMDPELLEKAILDRKEKTGKYGFYMQEPADFWAQQALVESAGADMLTADASGKKKASFAIEDGIAAMQMMQDMVKDGSALHVSWEEGCQSFIDGNCAMLYTTIARRASVQKGAQFDVATVKSPLWNDKERKVPAGGCFLAITAQSDEQIQAAWEFEKYLYSVESMAAWTEGTGYVPPRKDVAEAENGLKDFLAENTMMNAAIEQMDGVVSWTAFPGDAGLEAEQLLLDMRDQILGGQVSAKDGMTSTQDAINQLLDAQ